MYSGSIPPAALNYITPVQLNLQVPKRSLGESRSLSFTQRLSPQSPATDSKWSIQVDILSALKGEEHDYNARGAVVESISFLEDEQKSQLIEFLSSQDGAIASTLENNACKQFNCAPDELNGIIDDENLENLLDLWNKLHIKILPTVCAMTYNLKTYDQDFNIKKLIFTYFRNKVVVKALTNANFDMTTSLIRPMLLAIDFETRDDTENYTQFSKIVDVALGKISKDQIKKKIIVPETPSPISPIKQRSTLRPSKYSAPNNLVAQAVTREKSPLPAQRKTRSRTLPFKSVHWDNTIEFDDNTTVFI